MDGEQFCVATHILSWKRKTTQMEEISQNLCLGSQDMIQRVKVYERAAT